MGCLALAILLGVPGLSWSQQTEEDAIDTLDVMEIPGTAGENGEAPIRISGTGYS